MFASKQYYINSEKGFALVAALIAVVMLLALGALVIALSTGDLKTSSQVVADKRAMEAAEKGIHHLVRSFDPLARATCAQSSADTTDVAVDPHSQYSISAPVPASTTGGFVDFVTMVGQDMRYYGMAKYVSNVTGYNTLYNTRVTIEVGIGHGPDDLSTQYQ